MGSIFYQYEVNSRLALVKLFQCSVLEFGITEYMSSTSKSSAKTTIEPTQ